MSAPQKQPAVKDKPLLPGGNTIGQAQKPSKAKVTLSSGATITPSFEEFDAMQKRLSDQTKDLLKQQDYAKRLLMERDALLSTVMRLRKVLANFGVSTKGEPEKVVKDEEAP